MFFFILSLLLDTMQYQWDLSEIPVSRKLLQSWTKEGYNTIAYRGKTAWIVSAVISCGAEQLKKQHVPRENSNYNSKSMEKGTSVIVQRFLSVLYRKIPFKPKLEWTLALLFKDEKHFQIRKDWKEIQMCFFLILTGWFHLHWIYYNVGSVPTLSCTRA